ncbi:hypothetical protein LT493_09755 [Streptomyces tricolor]|nr:hypothetical protein [Streptomyces tricolor]
MRRHAAERARPRRGHLRPRPRRGRRRPHPGLRGPWTPRPAASPPGSRSAARPATASCCCTRRACPSSPPSSAACTPTRSPCPRRCPASSSTSSAGSPGSPWTPGWASRSPPAGSWRRRAAGSRPRTWASPWRPATPTASVPPTPGARSRGHRRRPGPAPVHLRLDRRPEGRHGRPRHTCCTAPTACAAPSGSPRTPTSAAGSRCTTTWA